MTARRKQPDVDRKSLILDCGRVVGAAVVFALGLLLLWGVWDGTPVAADFSRVGGASRVRTALEAARFWLTPPHYVVETQTHSSKLMLGAAQCAVLHDAPLLFTSPNPKQQRQVKAMISDWRNGVALHRITIRKPQDVTNCLPRGNLTHIPRLSRLWVPNPLIGLPGVPPQPKLAHVVVFAADIEPGHPPDVAVGLALAAHMARANRENVSLVVVPHYLESDRWLVKRLQGQHELVTGGVVLGQTPTVPEETRALLRQLITSRDRPGILEQLQENLGSTGSLIGALLALVGVVATARAAAPIVTERLEHIEHKRLRKRLADYEPGSIDTPGTRTIVVERKEEPVAVTKSYWRDGLDDEQEVTIWLRSGRQVKGIIEDQTPSNAREATVFRIKEASLVPNDVSRPRAASPSRSEGKHVLVSVREIELIDLNDSK